MNSSVYKISLDIHSPESQVLLDMKHFDTGRQLQISLTENGWIYPITPDCSAVFTAEKADGNKIYNECLLSGNVIVYDVTQQTTACVGEVACEIRLFNGEGVLITSPRFTIVVNKRVYNGEDIMESMPEADALQTLVSDAKKLYGEISENTKKAHTHDNKTVLDSVTQEMLEKIGSGLTEEQEADLAANTEARHTHSNKKTLDLFYCESLETGFATDVSSTALKWQGKPIAFDFAGSKVSMVQEVEKNGKRYYRLWFTHGSFTVTNVPDYIDIPIDTLNKVTESGGDITLNGAELDLGLGKASAGGIQLVNELPTNAKFGDVCLYARANNLSIDDSGATLYFSYDWLNQPNMFEEGQYFQYTMFSDVSASVIVLTPIDSNTVFLSISDSYRTYALFYRFNNGKFELLVNDSEYFSYYQDENGIMTAVTESPKTFDIPEAIFTSVENAELWFTLFYHEPKLMVYKDKWEELTADVNTDDIWTAIDEIRGGIDEIETLIDESGVLE